MALGGPALVEAALHFQTAGENPLQSAGSGKGAGSSLGRVTDLRGPPSAAHHPMGPVGAHQVGGFRPRPGSVHTHRSGDAPLGILGSFGS